VAVFWQKNYFAILSILICLNVLFQFFLKGSGPCLFCGALVCSKEETEVLNRNSKKSEQLRKKLLAIGKPGKDWFNSTKIVAFYENGLNHSTFAHFTILFDFSNITERKFEKVVLQSQQLSLLLCTNWKYLILILF
jgi:hypothetical protein